MVHLCAWQCPQSMRRYMWTYVSVLARPYTCTNTSTMGKASRAQPSAWKLVCSTLTVLGRSSVLVCLLVKLLSRMDSGAALPWLLQPSCSFAGCCGDSMPQPSGCSPPRLLWQESWTCPASSSIRAGAGEDARPAASPRQLWWRHPAHPQQRVRSALSISLGDSNGEVPAGAQPYLLAR